MTVPSPECQWPTRFDELGPVEDASILLAGTARIGGAQIQILGVRVRRDSHRMPDYQPEVSMDRYAADGLAEDLETLLEETAASEFEDVLADSASELVEIAGGHYLLLMVPARAEVS